MSEATERLVNLAMFLGSSPAPVTAEVCRSEVAGYPADQDDEAFARMFERDKDELRAAGLAIRSVRTGSGDAYTVDHDATHVRAADFTLEEEATLRVAAAALAADASFPFADDLRLALAKVLPEVDVSCPVPVGGVLADEDPAGQGASAGLLASAVAARKVVRFGYTNARGEAAQREVEPYGLFLREGRWYLVGRDRARGEARTFALARMTVIAVETARPKSSDFEIPADFDVSAYVQLPFQYGSGQPREAVVRLDPAVAWRGETITAGVGVLHDAEGGARTWHVHFRDVDTLARWLVANGPGLVPVAPPELAERLSAGLKGVAESHAS